MRRINPYVKTVGLNLLPAEQCHLTSGAQSGNLVVGEQQHQHRQLIPEPQQLILPLLSCHNISRPMISPSVRMAWPHAPGHTESGSRVWGEARVLDHTCGSAPQGIQPMNWPCNILPAQRGGETEHHHVTGTAGTVPRGSLLLSF